MSIPDIRRDARGWFQFFDRDRSGRLDKTEVIQAFVASFSATCDPEVLVSVVDQLWPLFDRDGGGFISEEEFLARDGLCDTMLAQFPHVPQTFVPPSEQATPVTMHCWSCRQQSSVQPPPGWFTSHHCIFLSFHCVNKKLSVSASHQYQVPRFHLLPFALTAIIKTKSRHHPNRKVRFMQPTFLVSYLFVSLPVYSSLNKQERNFYS